MSNEYELSLRIRELERRVDFLIAELGLQDKYAQAAPKPAGEDDVLALMRAGKKIEAIALYRRKHDVGLAEAKTAVEAME
jgi:ribosomal protein L7/L12